MLALAAAGLSFAGPARAAAPCSLPGAKTVLRSSQARVLLVRARGEYYRRWYGCLRADGRPRLLTRDDSRPQEDYLDASTQFVLGGATVAWVEYDSGSDGTVTTLHVWTLGTKRYADEQIGDVDEGDEDYSGISNIRVAAGGAVAWVLGAPGGHTEIDGLAPRASRPTPLAYAAGIDRRSLRLAGTTVRWRQRGTAHSAALLPPLPRPSGDTLGPEGLDGSFGRCGESRPNVPPGGVGATNAAAGPNGTTVVAGVATEDNQTVGSADDIFALVRYLPDGRLDPAFGSGGVVRTRLRGRGLVLQALVVRPDGRIVLVADVSTRTGTTQHFSGLLVGYDATGALDPAFGNGGVVTSPIPFTDQLGFYDAALTADGGLIATGQRDKDYFLARFREDGTLDPSFGTQGLVTPTPAPYGLAVAADGTIASATAETGSLGLARYGPDGARLGETSFAVPADARPFQVAALPGGGFALAGSARTIYSFDGLVLARLTATGEADPAFGRGGLVLDPDVGGSSGLAIAPDGGWIVAARVPNGRGDHLDDALGLARYRADGRLDGSFGWRGVLGGATSRDVEDYGLALTPGGDALVAGLRSGSFAVTGFALGSVPRAGSVACGLDVDPASLSGVRSYRRLPVVLRVLRPGRVRVAATLAVGRRRLALPARTVRIVGVGRQRVRVRLGDRALALLRGVKRATVTLRAGAPGGATVTRAVRLGR